MTPGIFADLAANDKLHRGDPPARLRGMSFHKSRVHRGSSPRFGTCVVVSIAAIFLWGVQAMAAEGLITIASSYGPQDTMSRLEAEVRAKGLTVFAHVDHAAGAAAAGLPLRPTDLLIFGNAKGGTPLMQAVQTMGIDLPLKVLVWQDAAGRTWLSYNDPG